MVWKMSQIICATEKIKVYEGLQRLCEYAGKDIRWCDGLWLAMLNDEDLYEEFLYYLEHHSFADRMKAAGYSLTDIYVWQMQQYNLISDTGKNTESCNKEAMVLQAFQTMTRMKKDPAYYTGKLREDAGMDRE